MEFTFNGVIPEDITFNGNYLKMIICNGVTVWEKKNNELYKPLTLTANSTSTISLAQNGSAPTVDLKYSLDGGKTWTQWDYSAISLSDGQSVCFKGLNTTFATSSTDYNKFVMTGSISASCNIMSIIDDGACTTTTIPANYCFYSLFSGCHSLTTAPKLPATTLTESCYDDMFDDCISLTTAPELPATTLADYCYEYMFFGCASLTTAPELPATTLAEGCYVEIFSGCTSLVTAPELPATTLAVDCYENMFANCTSLTTAPELPATTLVDYCYIGMFNGCTKLNYIKCLATDISATDCTSGWVNSVAATGTFVKAASMNDWTTGVNGIPEGWIIKNEGEFIGLKFTSTGNSTVALAQQGSAPTVDLKYSLDNGKTWTQWNFSAISLSDGQSVCFKGLNTTFATGESDYNNFVMTGSISASGNIMSIIDDGACTTTTIPADYCFYNLFFKCSSLTTAPELPATTLADYCYSYMFSDCTSLTTAPQLPATTLADGCYSNMFRACTSLTTAPELPATTLASYYCYSGMFRDCTSLTTAPALPATTLAYGCYQDMFYKCTSLITAPELPATKLAIVCYNRMFQRCTKLNYIKCLATDISAINCTTDWVDGVAASGKFVKAASMTSWTTGVNGIPSGWTVQNAA